jgi:hypothetical protein
VQVFLITTLTSAASSAITQIISNPLSARSLLSQNLPKASNFYISYFILQGLAMSATRIVHAASLVRHQLLANSPGNPRLISAKYHRLRRIHWGSVYPVFTNMGVIGSFFLFSPRTSFYQLHMLTQNSNILLPHSPYSPPTRYTRSQHNLYHLPVQPPLCLRFTQSRTISRHSRHPWPPLPPGAKANSDWRLLS